MTTRKELQAEFIELRNAKMKRGTCSRTRRIYFDYLADTDQLAELKTDEELVAAIIQMKA